MSDAELARLGGGDVGYIKPLTIELARELFPDLSEELPESGELFLLGAADGTPIALTDTRQAALKHAQEGEINISSVH